MNRCCYRDSIHPSLLFLYPLMFSANTKCILNFLAILLLFGTKCILLFTTDQIQHVLEH